MPGVHAGGHGLDALAVTGQGQARDVGPQRLMPIPVAEDRRQPVHVGREASGVSSLVGSHTPRLPAYPIRLLVLLTQSY